MHSKAPTTGPFNLLFQYLLFSEKLSLDFFAGGGLRSSEFDHKPINLEFYSPERGYTGIVPKIGFDIGVSF